MTQLPLDLCAELGSSKARICSPRFDFGAAFLKRKSCGQNFPVAGGGTLFEVTHIRRFTVSRENRTQFALPDYSLFCAKPNASPFVWL
jgi:hypothetical protein